MSSASLRERESHRPGPAAAGAAEGAAQLLAGSLPAELVVAVVDSIGARLLRRMGWRSGRGVARRATVEEEQPAPARPSHLHAALAALREGEEAVLTGEEAEALGVHHSLEQRGERFVRAVWKVEVPIAEQSGTACDHRSQGGSQVRLFLRGSFHRLVSEKASQGSRLHPSRLKRVNRA